MRSEFIRRGRCWCRLVETDDHEGHPYGVWRRATTRVAPRLLETGDHRHTQRCGVSAPSLVFDGTLTPCRSV